MLNEDLNLSGKVGSFNRKPRKNNDLVKFHYVVSTHKFNPLSSNPTKWSNTLKLFAGNLPSVFDHFVGLALQGLNKTKSSRINQLKPMEHSL